VITDAAHWNIIFFKLHGLMAGSPFQALYRQFGNAIDNIKLFCVRIFIMFTKWKGAIVCIFTNFEEGTGFFQNVSISGLLGTTIILLLLHFRIELIE